MTSSDKESIGVTVTHRKAYESSLPEILGLPKDEIHAINTDVLVAVGRVWAACEQIQGLRGEVVAMCLKCPQVRPCPGTQARGLLMCPRTCPRPRKQAQPLLGFARDANKDAQRARPSGGACSERLRSAERQGTNLSGPAERPAAKGWLLPPSNSSNEAIVTAC